MTAGPGGGGGDEGRVSVFMAIALTGVMILIGLVADGGARLRAMQRADNVAAEAARAAGQAIDPTKAIPGDAHVLDPGQAVAAATAYLAAADVSGTVTPSGDGKSVDVEVTITESTSMLSLIGIGSTTVTGRATAVLITSEDR